MKARTTPTLQHSYTPTSRVKGIEDEDENEAPHEWRPTCVFRLLSVLFHWPPKFGCHFQGTFQQRPNPGLKPWAVLCSRFAAKSHMSLKDYGLSLRFYPKERRPKNDPRLKGGKSVRAVPFHQYLPCTKPFRAGVLLNGKTKSWKSLAKVWRPQRFLPKFRLPGLAFR
jgi:hypothetical protein